VLPDPENMVRTERGRERTRERERECWLTVLRGHISRVQKLKKLRVELIVQIDKKAEFMVSGIIAAGDRRLGARSGTGKTMVELAKMHDGKYFPAYRHPGM
jgi:hypothetical protein